MAQVFVRSYREKPTAKQRAFVREYLIDLNATQAAIRAGYSASTANEQGSRLLANVSVKGVIEAAMDLRAERTDITADRVLRELAKIGFADIRKTIKWQGTLFDSLQTMQICTVSNRTDLSSLPSTVTIVRNPYVAAVTLFKPKTALKPLRPLCQ